MFLIADICFLACNLNCLFYCSGLMAEKIICVSVCYVTQSQPMTHFLGMDMEHGIKRVFRPPGGVEVGGGRGDDGLSVL